MLYCYDCSKKFQNLKELRHHERVHQRRSFCKECKMYFKTKISHEIHNLKIHPEPRPVRSPQQSQQPRQHREVTHHRRREERRARYRGGRKWRPAAECQAPLTVTVSSKIVSDSLEVYGCTTPVKVKLDWSPPLTIRPFLGPPLYTKEFVLTSVFSFQLRSGYCGVLSYKFTTCPWIKNISSCNDFFKKDRYLIMNVANRICYCNQKPVNI